MFSKSVIVDIVDMLPDTQADLELFLMKFEVYDKVDFTPDDTSISKKQVKIAKLLANNQELKDSRDNNIVLNIVQDRMHNFLSRYSIWEDSFNETQSFERIVGEYPY